MADETEKIIYDIVVDDSKSTASVQKLTKSIIDLSEANKKLKEEREKYDAKTSDGIAKILQLNAQIDKNTKAIDQQKAALTGSKDATAGFGEALNKLAPGLESSVKGFGGLLNSFKAIIASPIGLILAAVAGAFTIIKAAIEKSEPALDFIEDIMTAISTTVDTLLANLTLVGDFFGSLLVGDLDAAGDAFNKLADEISKNNEEAQKFLDLSRELEDAQFAFRLASADTENQIKALIIASKNRNLSFDEAQAKIQQAINLEKELTETRTKLAQQEAEIGVGKIALTKGVRKEENETFDAFVNRITKSGQFSKEENDKIVGYYEKAKQAASDSLGFQEKVQNQLDAIADKRAADAQKRADAEKKARDDAAKAQAADLALLEAGVKEREKLNADRLKQIADQQKAEEDLLAATMKGFEDENEAEQAQADLVYELEKKKTKAKQDETKIDFLLGQQKLANASTVLNQVAGLIEKNTIAYKVLAISQASIDTYRAAVAALAPPPIGAGPLFGPILAGTTIALGLANIAKIAGFADGGLSGTRIMEGMGSPINRSNGDNMLATIKTGEVILNEKQQRALGGDSTFARIGVPGFATGGISVPMEVNALQSQINSDSLIRNLINVISNQTQKVLVIEDVEALQRQRIDIRENATL